MPTYSRHANFVFILGMHCSGTSCLAGSLERCGLFLGDVIRQNQHNINGNHELKIVKRIHKKILASNGGTWQRPPETISVVTERQKKGIAENIKFLKQNQPCGLKDPRLVLLLDRWLEHLDSYTLVGTFRHPVAVTKALTKRHQIPEEEGYKLWLRYNGELIDWYKKHRFPLIEFDLSDIEAYCRNTISLAIMLGLKPDIHELHKFIDAELEHNHPQGKITSDSCREMYTYLKQHRHRPYTNS